MKIIDRIKSLAPIIKNMTLDEVADVISAYGEAAMSEFIGLPDKGAGKMTKSLYAYRKKKCMECPLKDGGWCDPGKTRQHVSELDENGDPLSVNGCGCNLWGKQRSFDKKCPAGEW